MPATTETPPTLETSIVGADYPNSQLAVFRPDAMIDAYQQLVDYYAITPRFVPVQTVDEETWTQWVYQNDQSDANMLKPQPHVVGTDFPLVSMEDPAPRKYSMGGWANRVHIPAGHIRFNRGPEDPIVRARRITVSKWIEHFATNIMNDLVDNFTIDADGGEFDAYMDNATGGNHATNLYNMVQPDDDYRFDEPDGDPISFFLDFAKVVRNQSEMRDMSGLITMDPSRMVIITDGITLASLQKKLAYNKIYYNLVSIGGGFQVPELGGFTFLPDNYAFAKLDKTYNGNANTKGFGLAFDAGNVPFYARQYFLGADGWSKMSTPNIGYGMEYLVDGQREGSYEVLYQAYNRAVVSRPDEMFVLGNLRAN